MYKKKQIILVYIQANPGTTLRKMGRDLSMSFAEVWVITEEMFSNKYIGQTPVVDKYSNDKLVTIVPHGEYFLQTGGYNDEYKKALWKNIWTKAKTIAIVVNAITALILSYFSYKAADTNNKIQEMDNKKSIIKKLESNNVKKLINKADSNLTHKIVAKPRR